jgi:hypothetical protein
LNDDQIAFLGVEVAHPICSRAARQIKAVRPGATIQDIRANVAIEIVAAIVPVKGVATLAAIEQVRAGNTKDDIVALVAVQRVAAVISPRARARADLRRLGC